MKKLKTSHQPTTRIFGGLAAILLMMAFWQAGKSAAAGTLSVYVVNYPLKYCAERIGAEHVNAVFPAPAEVDPAYWIPDTATIAAYQQADLILLNGTGYAGWIGKVSLPRSKLVNTSRISEIITSRWRTLSATATGPVAPMLMKAPPSQPGSILSLPPGRPKPLLMPSGGRCPACNRLFKKITAPLKENCLRSIKKLRNQGAFLVMPAKAGIQSTPVVALPRPITVCSMELLRNNMTRWREAITAGRCGAATSLI